MREGEWLRASRQQLGLTLKQLAEKLQMQGSAAADHLRHMERGRRAITGPIKVAVQAMLDKQEETK